MKGFQPRFQPKDKSTQTSRFMHFHASLPTLVKKMKSPTYPLVGALSFALACTVAASISVSHWHLQAHAAYYGGDSGDEGIMGAACGYSYVLKDFYGHHTAALSDALFQNGQQCGTCFELRCIEDGPGFKKCLPGKSLVITATNSCPPGSYGGWCDAPNQHFDLSVPAFTSISKQVGGIVPIQYRRVPCARKGGIRFHIKGNPFFKLVLIYNVAGGGDIKDVAVKGEWTKWVVAKRNWGEDWRFGQTMIGQALSFAVTTFDGSTVVSHNVANRYWEHGMTFEGSQFH